MVFGWLYGKTFSTDDIPNLDGKVAIITGGTAGLGMASAIAMAQKGAHVIITARSESRGKEAVQKIIEASNSSKVEFGVMDNGDLQSVRAFAEWYKQKSLPIHILLLNAGIAYTPYNSISGIEGQFYINHLSHFYLTELLLPIVKTSGPARVVTISSRGIDLVWSKPDWEQDIHVSKEKYDNVRAYGLSKLANLLFVKELTKRLGPDSQIYANSCHPGVIATNITNRSWYAGGYTEKVIQFGLGTVMGNTADKGALTQLYLATSEEVETQNIRGKYFWPTAKEKPMTGYTADEKLQTDLWDISERLVKELLEKK
ncbi:uncharacterized protein SPPG_02689 [Spizellomyces punctatus DAOM BR117]|uniref:Uncharacterized protein n=1 Tax=Spizellomyces punctatus (strain DAOM BR117) TaxID=645134 RepID=A0A0L0HN15_SPIPD|nr:uncharacterized protein SPPG_02689 [Spizellomyces punctatus DAOM BR117]KND02204.1 hypothetical protein SPPG_02689 [Spizellomyces punctatus DAOM BR117]|eukprot:XP_016610243.1 hypothetical protein SPPG_02689 [Spizellomyces punctatus DAOM BR117]